jgi:hypothetical protein
LIPLKHAEVPPTASAHRDTDRSYPQGQDGDIARFAAIFPQEPGKIAA